MMNTLLSILMFMTGMIGLAVSVILVCKKENLHKNLFLSLCLFALAVSNIYNFYILQEKNYDFPKIVMVLKSLPFLVAPCAYLYIRNSVFVSDKFKKHDWIHFIPLIVSITYLTIYLSKSLYSNFWVLDVFLFNIDFYTFNISLSLLWLLYAYTQSITVLNINKISNSNNLNKIQIKWLKSFSIIILSLFTAVLLQKVAGSRQTEFGLLINFITCSVLILAGLVLFIKPVALFGETSPF